MWPHPSKLHWRPWWLALVFGALKYSFLCFCSRKGKVETTETFSLLVLHSEARVSSGHQIRRLITSWPLLCSCLLQSTWSSRLSLAHCVSAESIAEALPPGPQKLIKRLPVPQDTIECAPLKVETVHSEQGSEFFLCYMSFSMSLGSCLRVPRHVGVMKCHTRFLCLSFLGQGTSITQTMQS